MSFYKTNAFAHCNIEIIDVINQINNVNKIFSNSILYLQYSLFGRECLSLN